MMHAAAYCMGTITGSEQPLSKLKSLLARRVSKVLAAELLELLHSSVSDVDPSQLTFTQLGPRERHVN